MKKLLWMLRQYLIATLPERRHNLVDKREGKRGYGMTGNGRRSTDYFEKPA